MPAHSFTQLDVWKKSHQVTLNIYEICRGFPREERYQLCAQMKSAAISIPANIAEGFGRRAPKEKARFYNIAAASAEELRHYLILTQDLEFRGEDPVLWKTLDEVSGMLRRLASTTLKNL